MHFNKIARPGQSPIPAGNKDGWDFHEGAFVIPKARGIQTANSGRVSRQSPPDSSFLGITRRLLRRPRKYAGQSLICNPSKPNLSGKTHEPS
jgi:hypothetical protein